MTTSPVVTITDELIAELEAAASYCVTEVIRSHPWSEQDFDLLRADERYVRAASPELVRALLAERAELKRRAAQGDWLIEYMASEREDLDDTLMEGCSDNQPHALRSIIDAAMQAAQ